MSYSCTNSCINGSAMTNSALRLVRLRGFFLKSFQLKSVFRFLKQKKLAINLNFISLLRSDFYDSDFSLGFA